LIHKNGKNYHFFLATSNSVARIQSRINSFYPFLKKKPIELPSISRDPLLVPAFIYDIIWNRMSYESRSIFLPPYVHYNGKEILTASKWPETTHYLDRSFSPITRITRSPFPAPSKLPFFLQFDTSESLQIGGIKNKEKIKLTKINRSKFESTKYISLRDIVNPTFSEQEVIDRIESLFFDKKSKNFLYRLVKILYSGTAEQEYEIISNLFAHETEFAQFLSKSMFTVEILPLIHGPFLQTFIASFDERYIKFVYPKLSNQVRKVLENSISKNKLEMIKNSPAIEPKPGEGFIEMLETEVYKKFSRNIYYESGSVVTYREKSNDFEEEVSIDFEDSKKVNFWINDVGIRFYGVTKTKLMFQTVTWIDTLRLDWFLSKREWEPYEFHRLPPNLILEIPYFSTGKFVVGGGITQERKPFEFVLQWFEY